MQILTAQEMSTTQDLFWQKFTEKARIINLLEHARFNSHWPFIFLKREISSGLQSELTGLGYTVAKFTLTEIAELKSLGYENANDLTTNDLKIGGGSKTVKIVWNDNNNRGNFRPASITVQMYKNGVAYLGAQTLNTANNGTVSLPILAYFDSQQIEIKYTTTVNWTPTSGYSKTSENDSRSSLTITYSRASETVTVKVSKNWVDDDPSDRPSFVTVVLSAPGEANKTATLSASNGGTYTGTSNYRYQQNSTTAVNGGVNEVAIANYTSDPPNLLGIDPSGNRTYEITNTLIP